MYFYQTYNKSLDNNCIKPSSEMAKHFGEYIFSNYRINKTLQNIIFSLDCKKTREKTAFILETYKYHLTNGNHLMSKRHFEDYTYGRAISYGEDSWVYRMLRDETAIILTKLFLEKEPEIFKNLCKTNAEFIDLIYEKTYWPTIERIISPGCSPEASDRFSEVLISKKYYPEFEKIVGNSRQTFIDLDPEDEYDDTEPNKSIRTEVINWVGYFGFTLISID